jgi:aspartyl-tRNA(Asn)/glutamyl-tRNA(Gln) amidotransferase subunit A
MPADDPNSKVPADGTSRRQILRSTFAAVPCALFSATARGDLADDKAVANDPPPDNVVDQELTETDHRMSSILTKFGSRLDDIQADTVREDVYADVSRAIRLSKLELDDLEGPATAFVPWVRKLDREVFRTAPAMTLDPLPGQNLPIKSGFATIGRLAAALRAGEVSSIELTEFYLKRLLDHGPKYNCLATLIRETALRQAAEADKRIKAGMARGPLDGIPYGAKDLLAAKGYPTSNGCAPFTNRIVDQDANVIRRLEAAGAVLVAKLAMVECAGGLGYRQANASAFGPGLTPYDTKRWSGGSSSGSGSAVAAGLVPFAIGSETWGSISTPASYCGLTGLRPTYGRVGRSGAFALSYTLDKIGPMTRTVEDAWQVLLAIAGPDQYDPSTLFAQWRDLPDPLDRPLKLAILKDGVAKAQPEQRTNFEKALSVFREFAEIVEIESPSGPFVDVILTILAGESASAFEGLVDSGDVLKMTAPEDRIGGYASRTVTAGEFVRAQRLRGQLCRAFDDYLAPYDAVLTVPTSQTALPIDKNFDSDYSHKSLGGPGNLCGTPALILPTGLDADGLPTSIQLDCRAYGEAVLTRLGHAFQSRTQWHWQTPGKV